ncbi:hypothetical protein V5O48_002147 [Marasmius crinis-equi]|uniref:F-box domain-containing protein n=1 Tax=Marasmius crinis-equi TaxID=585013 RepID=A0ABR3FWD8_9AGAR
MSGLLPLEISINLYADHGSLLELAKESHRWRSLTMNHTVPLQDNFPRQLPILEELTLYGFFYVGGDFPDRVVTPILRNLTLEGYGASFATHFDTTSVTTLTVKGEVRFPLLLALLEGCPKLDVLVMDKLKLPEVVDSEEEDDCVPVPLPITTLKILRNNESPFYSPSIFFSYFAFPSLHHLVMEHEDTPDFSAPTLTRGMALFRRLISSVPPVPLVSLDIRGFRFGHLDDLFDILITLSGTLSRLTLWGCDLGDEFLRRMTVDELLPHLTELGLKYDRWSEDSFSLLCGMIDSRWDAEEHKQKRLTRLHIFCREALHNGVTQGLSAVSEQGLQVKIVDVR